MTAAGFGVVLGRDPETGFVSAFGAANIVIRWVPNVRDILGTSDCDTTVVQTLGTVEQELSEFIDITFQRSSQQQLQLLKGRLIAENLSNVRHLKTACITVPTPDPGPTETITGNAQLTGMVADDGTNPSKVSGLFQISQGREVQAVIQDTAPTAANQVQILDDSIVIHSGNAGQTLLLQYEATGAVARGMGGPLSFSQSPKLPSLQIHGIVEMIDGSKWRYWAPNARNQDERQLDPTAESGTYTVKAALETGWTDSSFLYQLA